MNKIQLNYEVGLVNKGYKLICGVDEAGRGPLAGAVVAAAVILPLDNRIEGINDSKKLSPKKREMLYEKIIENAICYSIKSVDEKIIDEINILNATKRAMTECVNSLKLKPEIVLIDAVKLDVDVETMSIIKGDAVSYQIAAASILAKVTRDRQMLEYDKKYPEYGFSRHKGYGTKEHIEKIKTIGALDIHRKTFIKNFLR